MKCGRKSHFTKDYKRGQQNYVVKGTNILRDNNRVKVTIKCLIKHFAFYYNSACRVYKEAKYGAGQWPQEPELNHAKAIKELDNEQNKIHYGINIYGSFTSLKLVIYLIKEVDKTVNNNKTFQKELKELADILKVETKIVINSITVANIKTLLNIASITL